MGLQMPDALVILGILGAVITAIIKFVPSRKAVFNESKIEQLLTKMAKSLSTIELSLPDIKKCTDETNEHTKVIHDKAKSDHEVLKKLNLDHEKLMMKHENLRDAVKEVYSNINSIHTRMDHTDKKSPRVAIAK